MIILFSGCDKVKGFNIRIKEVINKELDRYNRMAVICASDDYSKNDTLIDGTSDKIGIRSMFNSIKEFYLIDGRTSVDDMINIIKKVDIIYLFGGNPLIQLDIIKRIDYKKLFKLAQELGVHCQAFSPSRGLITNETSQYTEHEASINQIDINIINPIRELDYNTNQRRTFRANASMYSQIDFGKIWEPLEGLSYPIQLGPEFQ